MAFAFLPLLAAAAAAPQPADMAVLAAFRAACFNVPTFKKLDKSARKAGWEAVAASVQPNLDTLVTKGREATLAQEPSAKLSGGQYRQTVGGRTLYLITSRYEDKGGAWSNGCRVYDFAATAPMPRETLVAWMTREPTGEQPLPDGNIKYLWEPGWKSGRSVEASFVTGTDPVAQQFGLKGLVLTANAIGGF